MARAGASRCALICFLITIVQGQVLQTSFDATVSSALMSLAAGYGLGLVCGKLWSEAFD